jgi:hypothetical protein
MNILLQISKTIKRMVSICGNRVPFRACTFATQQHERQIKINPPVLLKICRF